MSNQPIVVIPSDDPPQCLGSPRLNKLRRVAEVRLYDSRAIGFDEKIKRAAGASAIINSRGYVKWGEREFDLLPDLKFITVCGIGTDSIDLISAKKRGILVSNIPGQTATVVAEHAFGLMMAAAKRVSYYTENLKAGKWVSQMGVFLQKKTIGIIGTGNIGAEMARLCNAFGMNVLAWTFNPSADRAHTLGVTYVGLDELLSKSDVVSIHVALTRDTLGLIGSKEMQLMKTGSILVNTARGPIVDESALIESLQSGKLSTGALDVFAEEPLPQNSRLLKCDHLILTPHVADMTPEGFDMLNQGVVDNVLSFLSGQPRNVVN